jgi:hypothetical protein
LSGVRDPGVAGALLSGRFGPGRSVIGGEGGVAVEVGGDLGQFEPVRQGEGEAVDLATARDVHVLAGGDLLGQLESLLERMGDRHIRGRPVGPAGDDDGGTARQRAADRVVCPASHHQHMAEGEPLEPLQVVAVAPHQFVVPADHPIAGDGRDQDEAHTAIGALIDGCGS